MAPVLSGVGAKCVDALDCGLVYGAAGLGIVSESCCSMLETSGDLWPELLDKASASDCVSTGVPETGNV